MADDYIVVVEVHDKAGNRVASSSCRAENLEVPEVEAAAKVAAWMAINYMKNAGSNVG